MCNNRKESNTVNFVENNFNNYYDGAMKSAIGISGIAAVMAVAILIFSALNYTGAFHLLDKPLSLRLMIGMGSVTALSLVALSALLLVYKNQNESTELSESKDPMFGQKQTERVKEFEQQALTNKARRFFYVDNLLRVITVKTGKTTTESYPCQTKTEFEKEKVFWSDIGYASITVT